MTVHPTVRDYTGTLMMNADALAYEIRQLLDLEQNAHIIGALNISDILEVENKVVEMRNRIKELRGDFANIQT
jgi:hypothetical protein